MGSKDKTYRCFLGLVGRWHSGPRWMAPGGATVGAAGMCLSGLLRSPLLKDKGWGAEERACPQPHGAGLMTGSLVSSRALWVTASFSVPMLSG